MKRIFGNFAGAISLSMQSAIALVAMLLVLTAPALAAETGARTQANEPVVTVAEARPAEIVVQVPVTGTLVAREKVMVNPRIAGRIITALHADIGDHVEAGDLLAELDRDSLDVQLAQAEAEKERAAAAVKQAQSQVDLSQANLENARTTYERNHKLSESGTISQASVDQSETAFQTANASLSVAEDGLAVARAQLRQAEASLRLAKLNLSYTQITAPAGGTIAERNALLGAVAVAGVQPMFSIIANDRIELEAEILETEVSLVRKDAPASLTIAGIGHSEGRVRLIPPTIDSRTRLARIRIELPALAGLKIGAFARGRIDAQRFTALTVPVSAVLSAGGRDYVLVVGDDRVLIRRDVQAGAVWNGRRQIVSGLEEGERVLLRAGPFFQEGDRVEPVLDSAPARALTAEAGQ